MSIVMETKSLLATELEEYDDEIYVKIDIPKAADNSNIAGDILSLKEKLAGEYKDKALCIYSYTNLQSFVGDTFIKLPEDYMYKIDAYGDNKQDDDNYKLPKGFKSYFIETEEGYFVTIDDDENSVKDVASLDLFVYDNSMCIGDVYTEEDYRGQGLAKALIQLVRRTYKELPLTLHTDEDNEVACKLYESLGFYKEQIIYNYIAE